MSKLVKDFTGVTLKKSLGQHLLVKRPQHILDDFIDFLETNVCRKERSMGVLKRAANKDSSILFQFPKIVLHIVEIGPGTGALTKIYLQLLLDILNNDVILCNLNIQNILIKNIKIFIYFVELDPEMLKVLKGEIANLLRDKQTKSPEKVIQIQYFNYDATKFDLGALLEHTVRMQQDMDAQIKTKAFNLLYIFGALPYNVSKNIIIHAAQEYNKLVNAMERDVSNVKNELSAGFTYIIQKEVAESFVSKPHHSTLLSNMLQLYVANDTLKVVQKLPPSFFYPPPKVDSAILVGRFQRFKNIISRLQHISNKKPSLESMVAQHFINDLDIIYILKILSRYPRKTLGKIASMAFKKQEIGEDCRTFIVKYYKNNRFSELLLHDWIAITRHCVNR